MKSHGYVASALAACALLALAQPGTARPPALEHQPPGVGLQAREPVEFDSLRVRPGADFSADRKVFLEPVEVSFSREWSRDVRRTGSRLPLSQRMRDQLAEEIAERFISEMAGELDRSARFELVEAPGPGVVQVRPRLEEVFITAHDPFSTITSNVGDLVSSAGRATFSASILDGADETLLAELSDRRRARDYNFYRTASPGMMATDTEALFRDWARALGREFE